MFRGNEKINNSDEYQQLLNLGDRYTGDTL